MYICYWLKEYEGKVFAGLDLLLISIYTDLVISVLEEVYVTVGGRTQAMTTEDEYLIKLLHKHKIKNPKL